MGSLAILIAATLSAIEPTGADAVGVSQSTRADLVPPDATGTSPLLAQRQLVLDGAADDAAFAWAPYYTEAVVDARENVVYLYLSHAPQSVLDQLAAMHPGTYVIDNSALYPRETLLEIEASIARDFLSWRASGVQITYLEPVAEGKLRIGVTSDVADAQTQLEEAFGDVVEVVVDPFPPILAAYRHSDSAPWNGGDFIYHKGGGDWSSCTSGYPVHDTSTGEEYLLTAAHCFWDFGGIGTNVKNGYVKDNGTVYGSGTLIGSVARSNQLTPGSTSLDSALIEASSSTLNFAGAWDSTTRAVQIGGTGNHIGDYICTSGAFDGQICGSLRIGATDVTICPDVYCVWHLARAKDTSDSSLVAAGQGDSGGPVYSWTGSDVEVRGIIDAVSEPVSCPSDVPPGTAGRICGHRVYFTMISYLNSHWGIAPNS